MHLEFYFCPGLGSRMSLGTIPLDLVGFAEFKFANLRGHVIEISYIRPILFNSTTCTVPTDKIISVKNARAWDSMEFK